MSYNFYLFLHISGLILMVSALFGAIVYGHATEVLSIKWRKAFGMMHGIGLMIMFIAGFGLLARLQLPFPFPGWVWVKIVLWFIIAFLISFAFKAKLPSRQLWIIALAVLILSAGLAVFKPF